MIGSCKMDASQNTTIRKGRLMLRRQIYNLHSDKQQPPRFCDVIVEGNNVKLEVKNDKGKLESIPWEDVVYQVDAAKKMAVSQ